MTGQMAIAIALPGFNGLGRSVIPIFFPETKFYLQLYPHCPKMNQISMWGIEQISRFLFKGHEIPPSCGCKAHETMIFKRELVV